MHYRYAYTKRSGNEIFNVNYTLSVITIRLSKQERQSYCQQNMTQPSTLFTLILSSTRCQVDMLC